MKKIWVSSKEFVEIQPDKRTIRSEIATRQASYDFYSMLNYLPNPDPVLKKMGQDIKVYRELSYDAHMIACIGSRKAGTQGREWGIDRGKAKSRHAKTIQSIFDDLDMHRIIGEILDSPLYGFAPLEILWKNASNRYIIPANVLGKPPEWFYFSQQNELLFRSKANITGEAIPPKKFLLPVHQWSYNNPYGMALLSSCFWPVTFKKGGLKFWVMFTEKYGMPFIIAKQPRGIGEEETAKILEMLDNMVQDAIAVIPDDTTLDFQTPESKGGGSSAGIYKELIEVSEAQMSKAILGQTLTTQQGDSGSYSLGKVHLQVREDIIDADVKIVENALNTLIDWICEFNFGEVERPKFSMWRDEEVDDALAKRDDTLTKTGVKFTKTYYIKNYGLEEEDFEVSAPASAPPAAQAQQPEFAEGKSEIFPDQQAIDDINISPERLQAQAEGILKPIIDLIRQGKDYTEVVEKLAETFPALDTQSLENMLQRAIFVSELWGRLNAGK